MTVKLRLTLTKLKKQYILMQYKQNVFLSKISIEICEMYFYCINVLVKTYVIRFFFYCLEFTIDVFFPMEYHWSVHSIKITLLTSNEYFGSHFNTVLALVQSPNKNSWKNKINKIIIKI